MIDLSLIVLKPRLAIITKKKRWLLSTATRQRGDYMITVDRLMTKNLINIETGASTMEAAMLMKRHKIGSVFVKRENRIVGIITEPDIIRKVVGAERVPYYVPVEDIMSTPLIGIDSRRPITEAADIMQQYGTRHLAVYSDGSVIGVLSVRDLLHSVSVDDF